MKRRVFFILMLVWMAVIFWFSSRTAVDSAKQSNAIGILIGNWFIPGFKSWEMDHQMLFADSIDYIIRKCAHASEYAVLAVFTANFLTALPEGRLSGVIRKMKGLGLLIFTVFICMLYACTDEIHQCFVPGRACRFTDVMIDSCGALAGGIFVLAAEAIFRFFIKRRGQKQ